MTGWQRYLAALDARCEASAIGRTVGDGGRAALKLRPPATEAEIAGIETLLERELPTDYRALLAIANGQDDDGLAMFEPDCRLLAIDEVIEQWLHHGKFVVREWDASPVDPDMAVRPFVWHPTRIPFAADYLGQGPFLDLWPGPAGTVGQVIELVSECDFEVAAPSLDAYFARMASQLSG